MSVARRLAELGIELPPVPAPVAAYVPAVRTGSYVWTSGQLPLVDGALPVRGKVGEAPVVVNRSGGGLGGTARPVRPSLKPDADRMEDSRIAHQMLLS